MVKAWLPAKIVSIGGLKDPPMIKSVYTGNTINLRK